MMKHVIPCMMQHKTGPGTERKTEPGMTHRTRNIAVSCKMISAMSCLFLALLLFVVPALASGKETQKEAGPEERGEIETTAITDWIPKIQLRGNFGIAGASFENGWVNLFDCTMKGYGTPWVAMDLNYDQYIVGEEGAETYVGANGIIRFCLTDVGSGERVSSYYLIEPEEDEAPEGCLVKVEYYGWDGKKTGDKELGTFVNDGSQDFYTTFGSLMNAEINAVGAVPYGDMRMLTTQAADDGAACIVSDGKELVRYPDTAAEDLEAYISSDGKVLAACLGYPEYKTEVFTLGEPGKPAATEAPDPDVVYNDAETIRLVQDALNQAGYDAGPVDGVPGDRTVAAINSFREANGLEPTGVIDGAMLAALNIVR